MAEETPEAPREGWFRSPGGVLAHADGPSQVRAYTDRGYTEVSDADAVKEIGDGITLTVDSAVAGTFDAESVQRAVIDEGSTATSSKRSAAARKGAETKRRKAAEKAADAGEVELPNGDRVTGTIPDDERTQPPSPEG